MVENSKPSKIKVEIFLSSVWHLIKQLSHSRLLGIRCSAPRPQSKSSYPPRVRGIIVKYCSIWYDAIIEVLLCCFTFVESTLGEFWHYILTIIFVQTIDRLIRPNVRKVKLKAFSSMHKVGGRLGVVFRIFPQIEAKSGVKCVVKPLKIFIYLSKA